MYTEEELVEDFAAKVHEIIRIRQYTDDFVARNTHAGVAAHTYSGDVQMESDDKIAALNSEASLILVMLDDLDDQRKDKYNFLHKIMDVLKEE